MVLHTEMAFNKVKEDFSKLLYVFGILSRALPALFLVYALCTKTGMLWVNTPLLLLTFADTTFHAVTKRRENSKEKKVKNKRLEKCFKYGKLFINGIKLGINVYLIYTTSTHFNVLSVTLTSFSVIAWVLQVLLEIVGLYIMDKIEYLVEGIRADIDTFKAPVKKVGDFFKNITGKTVEEAPEPSKKRLFLEERVQETKAERKEKKLAEKLARKEKNHADKQAKKEAKAESKRTIKKEIAVTQNEREEEKH